MARQPRGGRRDGRGPRVQSVTITDKRRQPVDIVNKRLKMVIELDGVPHKKTVRRVYTTNDAELDAIMDTVAENMRRSKELGDAERDTNDLRDGIGDWAGRPEGEDKRRVAQHAMREVVKLAREGKELQASGKTRPQAFEKYAQTRSLKNKIWDELDYIGNHAARAEYLALEGPGDGTEYGELNQYMNDLEAVASGWNAVVTFMDTCNNPKEVDTEVTV